MSKLNSGKFGMSPRVTTSIVNNPCYSQIGKRAVPESQRVQSTKSQATKDISLSESNSSSQGQHWDTYIEPKLPSTPQLSWSPVSSHSSHLSTASKLSHSTLLTVPSYISPSLAPISKTTHHTTAVQTSETKTPVLGQEGKIGCEVSTSKSLLLPYLQHPSKDPRSSCESVCKDITHKSSLRPCKATPETLDTTSEHPVTEHEVSTPTLRPFSNYRKDLITGQPDLSSLPIGVCFTKGEIWDVWTIDLNLCNQNQFCLQNLRVYSCKKKRCPMIHDPELRKVYLKAHHKEMRAKAKRDKTKDSESISEPLVKKKVVRKLRQPDPVKEHGDSTFELPTATSIPSTSFPPLPRQNVRQTFHRPITTSSSNIASYAVTASVGLSPQLRAPPGLPLKQEKSWDYDEIQERIERNLSVRTLEKYKSGYGSSKDRGLDNMEVSPAGETSWHYFSLLPSELQANIWRFAILLQGATVRVRYHPSGGMIPGSIKIRGRSRALIIKQVNRAACAVTKLYLLRCLATESSPATVRINLTRDRLLIHNTSSDLLLPAITAINSSDRSALRYLAVPLRDYIGHSALTIAAICRCPNIYKVWFLVGDGMEDTFFCERRFGDHSELEKRIRKQVEQRWKPERKIPGIKYAQMMESVPRVAIEVIDAAKARRYQIDELRWL